MSVAKVIEIISRSKVGFEDAVKVGIARTCETVSGVASAWVQDQSVTIENGKITEYNVKLKVTFVLKPADKKKNKK